MAIFAYTGLMGHGKSYGVVENVVLPAIQTGRHVYTNIALNMNSILKRWPLAKVTFFESDQILERAFIESIPGGAVIVADEAGVIWPTGTRWVNMSDAQRSFFTEHRHRVGADGFSQEICLLVQDLSLIAKPVRDLVETTYICRKLSKLGLTKRYRVDVFDGSQTGQNPPASKMVAQFYGTYKKEVFQYYHSHTKKDDGANLGTAGLEKAPDTRGNVFKSPMFIGGAIFVLLALPLSAWLMGKVVKGKAPPAPAAAHAAPRVAGGAYRAPVVVSGGVPASPLDSMPLSEDWRYTGTIDSDRYGLYLVITGAKGVRYMAANECRPRFRDYQCVVDGKLVTSYSGEVQPSLFASIKDSSSVSLDKASFTVGDLLPSGGGLSGAKAAPEGSEQKSL